MTVAKSSWVAEPALSCTGTETPVIVPPHIVIFRSAAGSSWLLVASIAHPDTSELTTVGSEAIVKVVAAPKSVTQLSVPPVMPAHALAVVCVKFQVARES